MDTNFTTFVSLLMLAMMIVSVFVVIHTSVTGINTEQGNVGIAMQNCIVLHFFVHLDITGLNVHGINISQSLFELYIQKPNTRAESK